jgi:hypothetical protein
MSQKIYQIDAFADALFSGNPAAVCPLENWLDADIMQKIAAENNLAETAFTVPVENGYEIRWFTPEVEVDLCGHATLASAYTLMNFEGFSGEKINFFSRNSGTLTVTKNGDFLTLDFPKDNLQKVEDLAIFEECFAYQPIEAYQGKTDYLLIFDADDKIVGDLIFPTNIFEYDSYMLSFGKHHTFNRKQLINNRKKWKYMGVIHEYLECLEKDVSYTINGNNYNIDGTTGFRNKDPDKNKKDAIYN